jgi:hypothetical protein
VSRPIVPNIANAHLSCESLLIASFHADWHEAAPKSLGWCGQRGRRIYLRVAASLLPRHFKMETGFEDLTDEQLRKQIDDLNRAIAKELGTSSPTGDGDAGTPSSDTRH